MEHILFYNEDSNDSIKEMQPPKKLPPPLIDLTKDDIVLNVKLNSKDASTFNKRRENLQLQENSATIFKNNIQMFNECYDFNAIIASNENKAEKKKGKKQKMKEEHPSHWTEDMIRYYGFNPRKRPFSVEKLQAKMDKDPSLWDVSPRDLLYSQNRRIRSHVKCWNCCQFGHTVYQCREELQLPRCHMCGETGHIEKTCPHAVCLRCGNQMAIFVLNCYKCIPEARTFCSNCYLSGHNVVNCTDNWRRFHSTIGKTTVLPSPANIYKSQKDMWCCNCGRRGHNQITCVSAKDGSFPDTFPYVGSYETKFSQDIYSINAQEPVASTSAAQGSGSKNPHPMNTTFAEPRYFKCLSKSGKKKKRKRKKKKNNRRKTTTFYETGDVIMLK